MAWQSASTNFIFPPILYWTNSSGMTRTNNGGVTESLWYVNNDFGTVNKNYTTNKNYQFITKVNSFGTYNTTTQDLDRKLDIISPWGKKMEFKYNPNPQIDTRCSSNDGYLVFFSKPNAALSSSDMVRYDATFAGFGTSFIKNFKMVEMDWFIQGWALSPGVSGPDGLSSGWSYFNNNNKFYFTPTTLLPNQKKLSMGFIGNSDTVVSGFSMSNYISRYISYPSFNLTMDVKISATTSSYIDLYLVDDLSDSRVNDGPSLTTFLNDVSNSQFLGRIGGSTSSYGTNKYNFYGLTGNKNLVIRPDNTTSIEISDIIFDGSYLEEDNNKQFLLTNSGTYSEPTNLCILGGSTNATYSITITNEDTQHEIVGTPSNSYIGSTGSNTHTPGFFSNIVGNVIGLNLLNSKVGNGTFKSGVWENGVWNSGWRVDDQVYEFDNVGMSLLMETTNTKWRIEIRGPKTSTINFKIGDRVAIGNIVGIDINENRKLMTNYFTILSVNDNSIVVDFNNNFPLRRIEKDSENHKIKITRNVWLNGGFLNGYFEGVWNNGMFKGFPLLTEMNNSHWIDGKFDGGHFKGEYPEVTYLDTYYISNSQYSLGLTFGTTPHGLEIGDLIKIDKDDKTINGQYDGEATVVDIIDDYMILVDKAFGNSSTMEGGIVKRRTGTAVIQNFNFFDNNVATGNVTSESNLQKVYSYNSWIDVKYLEESATNLGRSQVVFNEIYGEYSLNNLYGHITEDVLNSVSSFRNSYDLNKTVYSLGTKYKIYEDFLGDISEFNEPFDSTINQMSNFYNNGWTFSFSYGSSIIKRESNETLKIKLPNISIGIGGIFNLENTNISISKKRYSIIEFDLLNFTSNSDLYYNDKPSIYLLNSIDKSDNTGKAFPDQTYVNHIRQEKTHKYEYFYNRRGLDMLLLNELNGGGLTASFDNIKFYEIDKVPFFKYTTDVYVNKSVQIPYQGIAPFIDYKDNEFTFVDNIDIGLDSLSTTKSFNPPNGIVSGGGTGTIDPGGLFPFTP